MNLLGALLEATKRGSGGSDPAVHNRLLRQEVDKQLAEYDRKLDKQIADRLAKMTEAPAAERTKMETFLKGKKAEGMQTLRQAAETQYSKNCR